MVEPLEVDEIRTLPADSRRLRTGVVLGAIVLGAALCALSAFDAMRAREAALVGAQRELGTLSRLLAEQTARAFQGTDQMLRDTSDWVREHPAVEPAQARARLAAAIAGLPQVLSLEVRDIGGALRYSSLPTNPAGPSQPEAAQDVLGSGLFVSPATPGKLDGRAGFTIARRSPADGEVPAFVVAARIEADYFAAAFRAIDPGPGTQALLFRADGRPLARHPIVDTPAQEKAEAAMLATLARQGDGVARTIAANGGDADRIIVVRAAGGYPVDIAVSRRLDVVLAAWRAETFELAIRTGLSLIVFTFLVAWLVRSLRRRDVAATALRDAEERYLMAVDNSAEERRRLEDELRQAQKMEAMGTLAGSIAHDFNNILGAIIGYGEMGQRAAQENTPLRRYLDNIMSAANRARRLVDQILAFARAGRGQRIPVNIQAVVQEAVRMLQPTLPERVTLDLSLGVGDAAILGDSTQLHQIVTNLCSNAVRAMSESGTLRVALDQLHLDEPRQLTHGRAMAGEHVRLTVSDTGCGIDPSIMDRIFDPFFTTRSTGVATGTGLGLSVVFGIVTSFGGAIDVESRVGTGTRFRIYLPRAGQADATLPGMQTGMVRGHGETVMVVDDEPVLVMLSEEMLAELGYEAVGFPDPEAALAAFRADPARFDAVLTDESMPKLTGVDLAAAMREVRADLPIVIMTGYDAGALLTRAREAGVGEVLLKPLRLRDVAAALDRLLPARAAALALPSGGGRGPVAPGA